MLPAASLCERTSSRCSLLRSIDHPYRQPQIAGAGALLPVITVAR
ncbi:MAG TPA: hypothetical protein VGJ20_08180 [Xanthobacteraceae bacterium]|jgi:hypothetical protein